MASIKIRSLFQLPSSLWMKTCHFLEMTDMFELVKIDVSFDRAYREVLKKQEVTLEFRSTDLSPSKTCDILTWRIQEALQLFGQYIHRVRFLIGNFCLHRDTFEDMIPALAQSRVLKSVRVKVQGDHGYRYILCRDDDECSWTQFLCACLEADKKRDISMSLTIKYTSRAGRESSVRDKFFCLIQPPLQSSPCRFVKLTTPSQSSPCRFVSKLTMVGTELIETKEERKSFPHRPSRISVFVAKLPALKKLVLPLDYVTEALLLQLAASSRLLGDLKVTNYQDAGANSARQPHSVSRQIWDSLTTALPGLRVTCSFSTMDFEPGFYHILREILPPNTPVSRVNLVSDETEEMTDILDGWCQTLDSLPETLSAELVTGLRYCPEYFMRIMWTYFDRNGFDKRTYYRKRHNSGYNLHKITLFR